MQPLAGVKRAMATQDKTPTAYVDIMISFQWHKRGNNPQMCDLPFKESEMLGYNSLRLLRGSAIGMPLR
jgi:hypothetical protein